jgi:hypothetical protein
MPFICKQNVQGVFDAHSMNFTITESVLSLFFFLQSMKQHAP